MDYVKAFLISGIICALVQTLVDKVRMMPGCMTVTLVVTGTILGTIGIYEPFVEWAGVGTTVPPLGFGDTLWKGAEEGLQRDGFPDVLKGGSTSSAIEISEALIFRHLGSLIFKPKMKD